MDKFIWFLFAFASHTWLFSIPYGEPKSKGIGYMIWYDSIVPMNVSRRSRRSRKTLTHNNRLVRIVMQLTNFTSSYCNNQRLMRSLYTMTQSVSVCFSSSAYHESACFNFMAIRWFTVSNIFKAIIIEWIRLIIKIEIETESNREHNVVNRFPFQCT